MDLSNSPAKQAWERIGTAPRNGINTPLFSLKTKKSTGIGEFLDLLPLIDWCHEIGFSIIQLLPLNDTGLDASPYNALSAFALNPISISLHSLPFVTKSDLKPFESINLLEKIPYQDVLRKKMAFLHSYFTKYFHLIKEDLSYKAFIETTDWLKSYALFKVLKARYNHQSWDNWPEEFKTPSPSLLEELYIKELPSMEFYFLLQYFAFRQLKAVKNYANEKGILLKGDIPILISPDSLDAWLYREDFNLDLTAGAPPDMFTPEGQRWGFPTYRWDILAKTNYAWWKARLNISSEFYDIFRIDHIIGFYRIWAIPKGKKATEGSFIPQDNNEAIAQGEMIIKKLLSFTPMFPIGEDLALFIDHIRASLARLAIPGTKIPRWERRYNEPNQPFIPYKDYPPCSLLTLSTHDTETLAEWWTLFPKDAAQFCSDFDLKYEAPLNPETRLRILHDSHHAASLFRINLLGEYLALIPSFVAPNPKDERINIPGTLLGSNWCHRYLPDLETIASHQELKNLMKSILK